MFAQHQPQEGRHGSPLFQRRRVAGGRTVQRTVLYLGEINDQQQAAWRKALDVFDEEQQLPESAPPNTEMAHPLAAI